MDHQLARRDLLHGAGVVEVAVPVEHDLDLLAHVGHADAHRRLTLLDLCPRRTITVARRAARESADDVSPRPDRRGMLTPATT
jgi:hypothetical protein